MLYDRQMHKQQQANNVVKVLANAGLRAQKGCQWSGMGCGVWTSLHVQLKTHSPSQWSFLDQVSVVFKIRHAFIQLPEVFLHCTGTLEEMVYNRQIYKQQQANSAIEGARERRYFEGVKGVPGEEGELWGLANLFKLTAETVVTKDRVEAQRQHEMSYRIQPFNAEEAGKCILQDSANPIEGRSSDGNRAHLAIMLSVCWRLYISYLVMVMLKYNLGAQVFRAHVVSKHPLIATVQCIVVEADV